MSDLALAPTEEPDVTDDGFRAVAQVSAADATGTQWTLRYELAVVHRDRWYVRTIQTARVVRRAARKRFSDLPTTVNDHGGDR